MKISFLLLTCFSVFALPSCDKDEPLEHLPGVWNLTGVRVNGQQGFGIGSLTFNDDFSGSMAITYTGGGIQITEGSSFSYEATNSQVFFTGISQGFTWDRITNRSDEQKFTFAKIDSGAEFDVELTFTR